MTSTAATLAAATWLATNLPPGTAVVSDDVRLVSALQADGVGATSVRSVEAARPDAFVVTTSTPGAAPTPAGDARTFVPVARFTGDTTIVVGQVVDDPLAALTQGRSDQSGTARAATTGLLRNPRLSVLDPVARAAFTDGRLDLRAAAFLAVVTGSGPVTVRGAVQDPAEEAADLPVRHLTLTASNGVDLRDIAAAVPSPYAPSVSTPPADGNSPTGTVLLTWPVTSAPVR